MAEHKRVPGVITLLILVISPPFWLDPGPTLYSHHRLKHHPATYPSGRLSPAKPLRFWIWTKKPGSWLVNQPLPNVPPPRNKALLRAYCWGEYVRGGWLITYVVVLTFCFSWTPLDSKMLTCRHQFIIPHRCIFKYLWVIYLLDNLFALNTFCHSQLRQTIFFATHSHLASRIYGLYYLRR